MSEAFIEGKIKPAEQRQQVLGLDENARFRLASQFRWSDPEVRSEALRTGDSLVTEILAKVDRALSGDHKSGTKPTPARKKENPYLMPAVHTLTIGGLDVRSGPVKRGNRSIHTNQHAALNAVMGAFEESTSGHDRRVVDEAIASVYGELRIRRDLRRQEERSREAQKKDSANASEGLGSDEVVLFERIA